MNAEKLIMRLIERKRVHERLAAKTETEKPEIKKKQEAEKVKRYRK